MSRYLLLKLITLSFLFNPVLLLSQPRVAGRHRIALALSGGSALGLAHIGVIQYFEEHRIPIDYIAGTSMGGLVAGLYSTGMSPADLKKVVSEADWSDLLSPNPSFTNEPIVDKLYWNRPSGSIVLRFGRYFSLPVGISSGESIAMLFSRYTAAYASARTFDELPIPFRCVATDLVTGDAVVIDHGSLPKALRATMALPGVFAPVRWGSKVLVDGGLVENLPVEAARSMGADVVIAVMFEGAKALQFTSLSSVLRQTVSIPVAHNERRSAALATAVIRVQTRDVSALDFSNSARLIQRGYEAAQASATELARFQVSPQEWQIYLNNRRQRLRTLPKAAPLVAVTSSQLTVQRAAEHEALRILGRSSIQVHDLEFVISGITSAGGLPGAYYEWQNQAGKPQGYHVEFLPRPSTLFLLRPELFIQLSSGEPKAGALSLGATVIPSSTYKSRYLGEVSLGYDPGIRAEYYHPFDGTNYFVSPGIVVQRYNDNLYTSSARSDFQRARGAASLRAGIGTGRFSQLSVGIETGYDSYSRPITVNGVTAHSGPFTNLETAWIYNTQDSGSLPSRGTLVEGSLGYSFRNTSFPYLHNHFSTFRPIYRRVSWFARSDQESSFGTNISFYDQFAYGGAGQLEAYRYQEFHANTLVSISGGAFLHIFKESRWSINPSLAAWYQVARLDLGSADWQTHQSTAVGTFLPTPIGTVGFALAFNEHGKARARLLLGSF